MQRRIRLAAALAVALLCAAAGAPAFELPEGDVSETARHAVDELGAPAALTPQPPPAPTRAREARIQKSWRMPAASLEARVTRTRREALGAGIWSIDAAATAALRDATADPLERAGAAVALAPNLPAAHMALASARWLHGDDPIGALRSVAAALVAATRHPEGAVWLLGSTLFVVALCSMLAALVTMIGSGLAALVHVAHDFGHLVARSAPEFARVALICGLLLVPLALGEGVFGLALGFTAVASFYGGRRVRWVLASSIALLGIAAFPLAELSGRALAFFAHDATAAAAYAVAGGSASPLDVARLRAHETDDDLALWALALDARQRGSVGQADAYYQRLLESHADQAAVVNNAANVRLDLDHMESAFALYGQALERSESAVVLFNLSQAYGRAFQVDDLARTLGHAQALDGELVARLTALEGTKTDGFVVDLPLPGAVLWRRVWESQRGAGIATELRTPLAPGELGRDPLAFGAAFTVVWLVFAMLGARFEPAHGCRRCGTRVCPRCDPSHLESEVCGSCTRLFFQPEKTDRALRTERIQALALRQQRLDRIVSAVSLAVPGAAGLFARRPAALLGGAFCFALMLACLYWRGGVVPDADVLGPAVPVVFLGLATAGLVGHAAVVATSLAARRKGKA